MSTTPSTSGQATSDRHAARVLTPADATAARLTRALKRNGYLTTGHVVAVQARPHGDAHTIEPRTATTHLTLDYSEDAARTPPARLFLKCSASDVDGARDARLVAMARREVAFYASICKAPGLPLVEYGDALLREDNATGALPVIPCYDADFDGRAGVAHFLLAGFEPTHMGWWDIPQPTPTAIFKQMAGAVARLHAAWWRRPGLEAVAEPPSPPQLDLSARRREYIQGETTGPLTPGQEEILRWLLGQKDERRLSAFFEMPQPHTLIHGDATFGNYFFPRDERKHITVLLDWQLYAVGSPAEDLPWILVHPLAAVGRQAIEREALDHYLDALREHGVTDYSRADLELDYRRALVRYLLGHTFAYDSPGTIGRALSAFEDWDCLALMR